MGTGLVVFIYQAAPLKKKFKNTSEANIVLLATAL